MNMENSFIVTGATGWVGRNILHELQQRIPTEEFNKKVFAFGSKKQIIKSTAYPPNKLLEIPIYPLNLSDKIIPKKSKILIIHTAFLTREKINYFGINKYININESIIRGIKSIINTALESKVVLISSGAASSVKDDIINKENLFKDPYGNLKRKEEIELNNISKCLTLRIYGLTGRFIRDASIFAFGNFLLCAKAKEAIKISSKAPVIRSYCYAGDVARLAINWLCNSPSYVDKKPIAAVSHTFDLLKLANLISDLYDLPPVEHEIDEDLTSNIYIAKESDYLSLLKKLKQEPTDMINQIKSTMDFIKVL